MEKKNLLGLFVFLGLVAIAVALPVSVKNYTSAQRSVFVKGLCEKEVPADRAIWPIVYKEGGNDIGALAAQMEKKNAIVVEWLRKAGFSDEEISISAPKVEDQRTYSYEHRQYDYIMTCAVTVCSDKVDKVVELQTKQFDLLGRGIAIGASSWEYPVVYEYTGLNQIKPEMIEQATQNARAAAQKFAKDSGSRVGKSISATQGQFSINDRDSHTPYIKTVRVVTSVNYQLK